MYSVFVYSDFLLPTNCCYAGVAHCLGELYRLFGRRVTSGLTETINIAAKLMKFNEDFVRKDALQMLDKALEGCGGSGPFTAYSEAHRIVMRVGVTDKSFIVRLAAARCLKTFANIDSPGLGPAELEGSIVYCLKALVDPTSSVRDAFAEALGGLLALATNPEAQVKRGNKITVPARKLEDNLQKHFILPFVKGKDLNACCLLTDEIDLRINENVQKALSHAHSPCDSLAIYSYWLALLMLLWWQVASGIHAKDIQIGLTLSWVFFLQVLHQKYHVLENELQNYALLAMDILKGNDLADPHALFSMPIATNMSGLNNNEGTHDDICIYIRFMFACMGDAGIKSAIQGSNVPNPDEAVPSFVSGAMAKAGKGLLEGTLQAGTSAVSDKLLDLVGLGGKSAADI
ncbi:hypothetical protein ZIOFF_073847 [Zingiber officinale]|uniref:ARM repeat superfamily protein n=1 Tax=Zingiber officinale TaxID=94328 RepID=A0A8J5BCM9_ZINOF|nr:hypothetical protein ZIOFF_073847 [Zingiber officinale]